MAMDFGSESAGEPRLSCTASPMATSGDHGAASASQMPTVCAREVFDERSRDRSTPDEGSEAPVAAPLWADVPADILGSVLRLLPCLGDRASVRSVCRHWRSAVCVQILPAPLPVLVLPRFRFSCLTCDGALTAARRARMPVEVAGDDVRAVGSFDDWLMAVRPSRETDGECFLVNAFSSKLVHLPPLMSPCHSSSVPTSQRFFGTTGRPWPHRSATLSASPSSGSKYIVAALSFSSAANFHGLALWRPGMTSWYLYRCGLNTMNDDLAFYQGKLYMVWKTIPIFFAFELNEDEHGVSLSCPQQYRIDLLITPSNPADRMRCNIVVWRGKLLLIIRFFSQYTYWMMEYKLHSVKVFALDFSTSPCGFTQIPNFDGDCIFVDTYGCRHFSPSLLVGVHGDLIYFSDDCINDPYPYVYNMIDGTMFRFATGVPEGGIGFPIWIFPS